MLLVLNISCVTEYFSYANAYPLGYFCKRIQIPKYLLHATPIKFKKYINFLIFIANVKYFNPLYPIV